MKEIVYFIFLLLLFSCGSSQFKKSDAEVEPTSSNGVKGTIGVMGDADDKMRPSVTSIPIKSPDVKTGFSDRGKISEIMYFLASDELQGRDSGSEGIEKAAYFIEGMFKENKVKPYFVSYRDTLSNFKKPAYNIIGVLEGSDSKLRNEYIIIGAHYDHIGTRSPVNGDTIANGANDNAAGTTVVLELARYFSVSRSNKRSLVFALFSAEEQGLLGSKHIAKKLKGQGFNLYTMLNFEMVGVPMVDRDYLVYASGYERSNLGEICNKYAREKLVGFLPTAKEFNLFMRSDNYPFHIEFGIPSHTFSTFDFTNFDHYHKVSDEVSLMDFDHMATLINKFIPVIEGIANASEQEIKYN